MAREQLGICAEPNLHGLVFLLNAIDGHQALLRQQLARLPMLINRLSDQFSEANLSAVVAIGVGYWDTLYPEQRPDQFTPFPSFLLEELHMSAKPYDLMLQIRADRYDVLHVAAQQSYQLLMPSIEVAEQIHCFRYLDGRELTGFIDQPDAVKGRRKRAVALIDPTQQAEFAGGSYVHLQRSHLDLSHWQQLTQAQQEAIIGRKKLDGTLLPLAQRAANCHAVKAELVNDAAEPLPLLLQNMPFGQLKVQGLLTLGFSCHANVYPAWLAKRLGYRLPALTEHGYPLLELTIGDEAAEYDALLDYIQIETSAVFFAPSISFMEHAAGI